ncbi:MAG TPA: 30S ribosomal protein S19 [Candidatus Dojkabacteria bacterium]|nr:30S ribosomal protein S19 [Candidatus Dojkabacteria bacterium]HQG57835.1 30S ribosomal protein S19 [Candidatus Dojkabacteria bacterium]
MSRSIKKGVYTDEKLMKKVAKALETGSRTVIKTWARDSVIVPDMVGLTFAVHNGKKFENVLVIESMIGNRLGEFAKTRTFLGHAKKGKISKVYGGSGRVE